MNPWIFAAIAGAAAYHGKAQKGRERLKGRKTATTGKVWKTATTGKVWKSGPGPAELLRQMLAASNRGDHGVVQTLWVDLDDRWDTTKRQRKMGHDLVMRSLR